MHIAPLLPPLQITREDLEAAEKAVGEFGGDNRAGVQGTLHRISAIRNRRGTVVGLTCRVGRAVTGHIDMIRDILDGESSMVESTSLGWWPPSHCAASFFTQHVCALQAHLSSLKTAKPVFLSVAVPNSVLFLGRPGVGKTTVIREMARVLSGTPESLPVPLPSLLMLVGGFGAGWSHASLCTCC